MTPAPDGRAISRRATRGRGAQVAAVVSVALGWTAEELPTQVVRDLAPTLVVTGAGPLAWLAARRQGSDPALEQLRDTYRTQVLRRTIAERQLVRVAERLDGAGVDWLTGKGWTVARRYPDPSARPYGDIDIYVRPGSAGQARQLVRSSDPADLLGVDVHDGLSYLDDLEFDVVYERAEQVSVNGAHVPTLSQPDLTRLVSLHALAEGVVRPVWLCDVGVLAGDAWTPADQDVLFGGSARRASYVGAAMTLARAMLAAPVPDDLAREPLRRWMVPSVLQAWGGARRTRGSRAWILPGDLGGVRWARVLVDRWPTPFQATVMTHAPLGVVPRPLVEVADCARWYRAYRGRRVGA